MMQFYMLLKITITINWYNAATNVHHTVVTNTAVTDISATCHKLDQKIDDLFFTVQAINNVMRII